LFTTHLNVPKQPSESVFLALEIPSTEVPQELSRITQKQEMETGSFLTILVVAIVLSVIAIATVVVIYKKLKLAEETTFCLRIKKTMV
jgi:hypothetical protein